MRVLLALLLASALACASGAPSEPGPNYLYVDVMHVDTSAFPLNQTTYVNAYKKMLDAVNATSSLISGNPFVYAATSDGAILRASLLDLTGHYVTGLVATINPLDMAVFVRNAGLTCSSGKIKIQTTGSNGKPSGGHTFTCGGAGTYSVGILCPDGCSNTTHAPHPPPKPFSPPSPPKPPKSPSPPPTPPTRSPSPKN